MVDLSEAMGLLWGSHRGLRWAYSQAMGCHGEAMRGLWAITVELWRSYGARPASYWEAKGELLTIMGEAFGSYERLMGSY